ncbi:MAG: restriction endonuclease subunit S [Candidatus Gastranaerophilales bacterium]|nr:restriction endonuclease subunit S [Candidatus Gastranaerophilales bacterium]
MFKEYRLGDLCTIECGSREKGGALFDGIPSIGGEQINSDGTINVKKMKFISEEHFANMKQGKLEGQDVLLVKDGATTGKTAYYNINFPKAAVNEHVFILRANEKILSKLLFYKISSKEFQNIIKSEVKGIIGGINLSIKNIKLEIPELKSEQEEIVKILDCASEIIRLRKECIKDAQDLIPAIFQEMFGNSLHVKKLEQVKLKSLILETEQKNPNSLFDEYFYYVDISSINNELNRIETPKKISIENAPSRARKLIKYNDVLISMTRPYLKGFAIVPRELDGQIASTGFSVLRADTSKINPLFLFAYTKTDMFINQLLPKMKGANYPAVRDSDVKNVEIPILSMKQQELFAQKAIEIEEYIKEQQKELKNLEDMFQSLLHHAFTGELTKHKFRGEDNA